MTLCMTFSHVGNTWKTLTIWFAKVGTKQGFWKVSMDNSNLKQWKWMLSHLYFQLISFWDQITRRGGSQYWIQRIPCLKSWNNVWISMFHNYCYCHCYLYCCASKFNNVHRRRFKGCTPPLVATTIVKWLLAMLSSCHCCTTIMLPLLYNCGVVVIVLLLWCHYVVAMLLLLCCYYVITMLCCHDVVLCCYCCCHYVAIASNNMLCYCYYHCVVLLPLHYCCCHDVVSITLQLLPLCCFTTHKHY